MAAPVRGTQSFVGVMGQVWSRPSLSAMEIAWRWLAGAVLFVCSGFTTQLRTPVIEDHTALLHGLNLFHPEETVASIQLVSSDIFAGTWPLLRWCIPALFIVWNLAAAAGRTFTLRRLDRSLQTRYVAVFVLGTLRSLLLGVAWWVWFKGLAYAASVAITAPAALSEEPSLVTFSAMLICGTLFLYVVWAIFSWFLQLAPLLAMRDNLGALAALRAALSSSKNLRSKLIEINLVMNIVRIALIVLAMVMSASPLAFQTVATQQFFIIWWCIAVLLYLAASDYFHVVRAAAYLSLHQTLTRPQ